MWRKWMIGFAVLLCGSLLAGVAALGAPGPEAVAEEEPAASAAEYHLQIGDVVGVVVLGEAAYSGSFMIRADGTVLFNDDMVGALPVGGLTVAEATQAVTKRVGEFVKDPSVSVTVNRFKVMVVGEVQKPGQYDLDSGMRLADAIARAGGARDEKRDLAQVYVRNVAGKDVTYDLCAFREDGDDGQNPVLVPGDRVSVGREVGSARAEYRVSGAVRKAGYFPLDREREVRVMDAVEECGRWTDEANPRAARLVRKDGTKLTLDLTVLDGDPTSDDNKVLVEGDELYLPRNPVQVSLLGGVKKEGQYRVPTGTTLLEAIAIAGGLAEGAVLNQCTVVRNAPTPSTFTVDLNKLMKKNDMTQNPVLQDRDTVWIGQRGKGAPKKPMLESVSDAVSKYWWLFRVW